MRRRASVAKREKDSPANAPERIAADLERRGVSADFSGPVAERLADRCGSLDSASYAVALDAVTAAYAVHQLDTEALEASARTIGEIQRLMQGFAGELRKVEEGLRIVSAYVLRMHNEATRDRGGVIH